MNKIAIKTIRWLFFGVLIALVPLVFTYISLLIKGKNPTLQIILSDGGLLLIVSSFCAGALGEMIGSTRKFLGFKIACSGATTILFLLSTLVFASVAEAKITDAASTAVVEETSLIVFICGVISCAACMILSET